MRSPGVDERRGNDVERLAPASRWHDLRPGRSVWRFAALVAAGWAVFVAALGTAVRLLESGAQRPSWGEVIAAIVFNYVSIFLIAAAISLIVRSISRMRNATTRPVGDVVPSSRVERAAGWTVGGHAVVPTTTEGRWALLASLVAFVPFVGGPSMVAAVVLLVLAVRRGDRALLLVVPLLVGLFLVIFIVAEFTIGHDDEVTLVGASLLDLVNS